MSNLIPILLILLALLSPVIGQIIVWLVVLFFIFDE